MGLHIKDYGQPTPPKGVEKMTTAEVQEKYEVLGFAAPYVVVRRRSDGVKGVLEFTHNPRFYFNFVEANNV